MDLRHWARLGLLTLALVGEVTSGGDVGEDVVGVSLDIVGGGDVMVKDSEWRWHW